MEPRRKHWATNTVQYSNRQLAEWRTAGDPRPKWVKTKQLPGKVVGFVKQLKNGPIWSRKSAFHPDIASVLTSFPWFGTQRLLPIRRPQKCARREKIRWIGNRYNKSIKNIALWESTNKFCLKPCLLIGYSKDFSLYVLHSTEKSEYLDDNLEIKNQWLHL